MRAHIDTDKHEHPASIVRRLYIKDFLMDVGSQFNFDASNPVIVARIIRMGFSYIALRRIEDQSDVLELRKRYNKLAKKIHLFRGELKKSEELDLDQLMYFSTLGPDEGTRSQHFAGGEAIFRELLSLLEILSNGVAEQIRRSAPKRGPRINWGLEVLTVQATQFFAIELNGRPFTVDQNKPFKPTVAFDFIKALVRPLDIITDKEIITAIRAAKNRWPKG